MMPPVGEPWANEPDHFAFEEAGLLCQLWRNRFGVWCGYVGLPPSHPCYGEQRGDLQALAVHGGITYAGAREEWGPGWWVGFDCGHGCDLMPLLPLPFGVYRTVAYAEANTRTLARQLAKVAARQWV